jgi:putative ABC transport system substrate-binding protein
MRRREFISLLGGMAAAWPLAARAQQQDRVRRVVNLEAGPESDPTGREQIAIFGDGMRKLGWIEGRNIKFEVLWQAAMAEQAKAFVAQIIANPPDVVVASTLQVFFAMRRDASAIPMVFTNLPDPVGMGFVSNLAKPDGNFTGFTAYEFVTAAKWLEVLKELAPQVTRVAMIIANSSRPVGEGFYRAVQRAAESLGVETTLIRSDGPADVQAGIEAFAVEPNGGLLMAADPSRFYRGTVIAQASRHQLPAVYPYRGIVDEGGLAFYGIDFNEQYRGAATYVDRILRGAKPADLPIQAPTKFELEINLKVAKALGLSISSSMIMRADEVIE